MTATDQPLPTPLETVQLLTDILGHDPGTATLDALVEAG
jgi:hypothetical protein